MVFVRTRSGRYLALRHIVGFAVEEHQMEIEGKRTRVFHVIAYLPPPLNPAILSIFLDEDKAQSELESFVGNLIKMERGMVGMTTDI